MKELAHYPITPLLPELSEKLAQTGTAVLSAPTGSGKSTVLPLALLDAPWLAGRKIVMLEPRRIAAYAVAAQLADNYGEPLGAAVGFRMRLERKISAATRLEVVTEGILTRMLQRDPELSGVGLLIFDEFHERSLHADLALALALDVRRSLRSDLAILLMSATLECDKAAARLGGAPILRGEGRAFPVTIRHVSRNPRRELPEDMIDLILTARREDSGSMLVFLPGEAEIRRTETLLGSRLADPDTEILPLYGRMELAAQRRAILPCRAPRRKIVLATSIAESSLTIDGVRIVVDSGLARVSCFDPADGLTRLETVRISQAAAAQRAGRAGRTEPGTVWRLWSEAEEARREPMRPAEIMTADLSGMMLELAAWGVTEPETLCWMEPPPRPAWLAARKLLQRLGALDETGSLTPHGRRMHETGLSPRIAHMAVRAAEMGQRELGALLAGLLDGFDFRKAGNPDLEYYLHRMDRDASLRQARQLSEEILRRLRRIPCVRDSESRYSAGALLALAFPDRVGRRRGAVGSLRYLVSGGKGGVWREMNDLASHEFLVIPEMTDRAEDAEIRLAAAVDAWEIEELFAADFHEEVVLLENRADRTLEAVRHRKLGAIIWQERRADAPERDLLLSAVGNFLRRYGMAMLDSSPDSDKLRARVNFLRRHDPGGGWPDWSEQGILERIEEILSDFLPEKFSKNILRQIDFAAALRAQLPHDRTQRLNALAPEQMKLENGRVFRIDYSVNPPVMAGKLQWFFGVRRHPALLNGKLPLTVHLLSPAGRPVQITTDLPGFWQGSYRLVRTELRGRYPKHDWPENP